MSAAAKELFSDGSSIRILSFEVRTHPSTTMTLALNIQKIKEIVESDDYQIQPMGPTYFPIIGLVNLRGLSVPVLDLNHFLTGERTPESPDKHSMRIIICEFQKLLLGIIVEKTHKIKQFDNSLVHKVPDVVEGLPHNIFNGIVEVEGKFIQLLDIEFILTKLNVDVAPDAKNQAELTLKGKHILIVEDSRLFQKKLVQFFRARGAEVTVAEDGVEGFEKLKSGVHPDLIFTDIEMPRLNGIGMIRKVKQDVQLAQIPVVFNTSISNPGLIEDIVSEGLGDYIVKFDEGEIVNSIRKYLG